MWLGFINNQKFFFGDEKIIYINLVEWQKRFFYPAFDFGRFSAKLKNVDWQRRGAAA